MSESDVERALMKEIELLGGLCRKFTSPGARGVPDRICIMEYGVLVFVETKTNVKRGVLSPLQRQEIKRYKMRGHSVYVIDSIKKVRVLCDWIQAKYEERKKMKSIQAKYEERKKDEIDK